MYTTVEASDNDECSALWQVYWLLS